MRKSRRSTEGEGSVQEIDDAEKIESRSHALRGLFGDLVISETQKDHSKRKKGCVKITFSSTSLRQHTHIL